MSCRFDFDFDFMRKECRAFSFFLFRDNINPLHDEIFMNLLSFHFILLQVSFDFNFTRKECRAFSFFFEIILTLYMMRYLWVYSLSILSRCSWVVVLILILILQERNVMPFLSFFFEIILILCAPWWDIYESILFPFCPVAGEFWF